MGPGFVHPGNCAKPGRSKTATAAALQWGPGLYTREIWPRRRSQSAPEPLQWGPGLYTREITELAQYVAQLVELQWGPGLYTREMAAVTHPAPGPARFNGARVCTPGK